MNKILRLFGVTFAIACAIGAITSLVGWLAGWSSDVQFSNGCFWVGAVLIALGALSVMGGYGMRADYKILFSQSAGDMNTLERSRRWIADTMQGYGSFVFLLLTGAYLIGFAVLIPKIF